MLDELALFVDIVEAGSLNAAARRASLPAATVTRRLQALERQLGCRLLHRSARRMLPTAEGLQYYEQCRPLVRALAQTAQALDTTLRQVSGNIRILAPVNLASGLLTPAWTSFLDRHPGIRLELQLSNALQDLVGSGADLAIRVGALSDSTLTQRRLCDFEAALVAAPAYLQRKGEPRSALDLHGHDLLVSEPLARWQLIDPATGEETVVQPLPRMRVNEMRLAVETAEAGLGILLCPLPQCAQALARGSLVRVLDGWVNSRRTVFAVWSQQRLLPARVRALVDHLVEFAQHGLFNAAPAESLSGGTTR
jgi:LysR family transcriptional regulator AphB